MEENLDDYGKSVAAPLVFILVVAFQYFSKHLEDKKKKESTSDAEIQLRMEIKQLYREAGSFSQPSTFAQAAKLRRMAAAKEKELAKIQESHSKEINNSYDSVMRALTIAKVVIYFLLICWFWGAPVAAISEQLVQPFGKVLSWRAGGPVNHNVMVGIIPWLIVSTRVSKFIFQKFFD